MRGLFYFIWALAAVAFLAGCSEEETPEQLAAKAAKAYYDHLAAGRCEEFVAGMADTDSLPPLYRSQLVDNAMQFVATQKSEHGGINAVRVVNAVSDTLGGGTNVFLVLCFGDSVNEEVVVPMVKRGESWKMR